MDSKKLRLEIRNALRKVIAESKTLYVNDGASDLFDNVNDIAIYVLRFINEHEHDLVVKYDISFGDLTADGGSELTSTGVMNFYYKQINLTDETDLKKILGLIKYALSEKDIQYGEFKNEDNRVIRIPILVNDNEKTSPHAQFSNGMFELLFNEFMQVDIDDETGLISVRDLLIKANQAKAQTHNVFPAKAVQSVQNGVITANPSASMIDAQLDKLIKVLNWATKHNVETVYVV